MRFELFPAVFRTSANVEAEGVRRTISFNTTLAMPYRDTFYDSSGFKDGRAIGGLSSIAFIGVKNAGEDPSMTYVPAYGDAELRINEPDCLRIDVVVPHDTFGQLSDSISHGKRIVRGGEINGPVPRFQYGPGHVSYVWDIEVKENQKKPLERFWFVELVRSSASHEIVSCLDAIRSQSDTPGAFAGKLRDSIKSKSDPPVWVH